MFIYTCIDCTLSNLIVNAVVTLVVLVEVAAYIIVMHNFTYVSIYIRACMHVSDGVYIAVCTRNVDYFYVA